MHMTVLMVGKEERQLGFIDFQLTLHDLARQSTTTKNC